ncbi:hypothetical protein EMPS_04669 [Entomortierella parvispora]|uniref:Uncharacterized protein n=1 Tax=Entomortierella parvispora TaxID=205924 RepID=A0A9P3H920_9FUNG|nr:hypothetical protein EMPS_04669 [Entomortierella parvispora]
MTSSSEHPFADSWSTSPLPFSSSEDAHHTLENFSPPVPAKNDVFAFQTLQFSFQARGVELTPPVLIATNSIDPNNDNDNGNNNNNDEVQINNNNIDLTGGSTLSVVQPSRATISRSKVSHSGVELNGTMTLAYMACQMLPDPIHVREVSMAPSDASHSPVLSRGTAATGGAAVTTAATTTAATTPLPSETVVEGDPLRRLVESAFAIEYFKDQDCSQFLMATAGSKVNIQEAEDRWINTYDDRLDSRTGATTGLFDPKTFKDNIRHGRAVSVRWVGLVSLSEFLLEKSKRVQDLERRRHMRRAIVGSARKVTRDVEEDDDEDDDDEDDDEEEDDEEEDDEEEDDEEEDDESVDDDDEDDDHDDDEDEVDNDAHIQDDEDDSSPDKRHEINGEENGYVSWVPFLPSYIYPPPRIVLDASARVAGSGAQGTVDPTSKHNSTNGGQKGAASRGLDHETSQIVMAGLVVGLLLFLGSFLMAVHYRQRRKKWYEEDGEV